MSIASPVELHFAATGCVVGIWSSLRPQKPSSINESFADMVSFRCMDQAEGLEDVARDRPTTSWSRGYRTTCARSRAK
jgi:hypothetical protein